MSFSISLSAFLSKLLIHLKYNTLRRLLDTSACSSKHQRNILHKMLFSTVLAGLAAVATGTYTNIPLSLTSLPVQRPFFRLNTLLQSLKRLLTLCS